MDHIQKPSPQIKSKRHTKKPLNTIFVDLSQPIGEMKLITKKVSSADLDRLTVNQIKQLVRSHNYHYAIKGYSKLKKDELIRKFVDHHNRTVNAGKAPSAHRGKSKSSSKKLTKLDKAMGINQPLHNEGVAVGARKQFEKGYGHIDDAKALRDMEKQMKLTGDFGRLGRGKRVKKPTAKARALRDTLGAAKVRDEKKL